MSEHKKFNPPYSVEVVPERTIELGIITLTYPVRYGPVVNGDRVLRRALVGPWYSPRWEAYWAVYPTRAEALLLARRKANQIGDRRRIEAAVARKAGGAA